MTQQKTSTITEGPTPYQQQILDLLKEGWTVFGHDLKYNMRWCAYVDWEGNNGRKWIYATVIKGLLKKALITIEPDELNPGQFKAKLRP